MTNLAEAETSPARIAVAIPCFNEAAAIASVIEQYRASLPDAELVVFDNNSTDGTGEIARGLGVRVIDVPEQGKGHAVRAAIGALLSDFDVVVLTDGDGTYPAEAAPLLVGPLVVDAADMAVGGAPACAWNRRDEPDSRIGEPADSGGFPDLDRSGHHRSAFRLPGLQPAVSRRPSSFARAASRSRPSWPARRLRNGFASSRSRFRITPGSPARRASCEHFAMAGGS